MDPGRWTLDRLTSLKSGTDLGPVAADLMAPLLLDELIVVYISWLVNSSLSSRHSMIDEFAHLTTI